MWPVRVLTWLAWVTTWLVWVTTWLVWVTTWLVWVTTWLVWVTPWLVWVTPWPFGVQPSSAQELPCKVPVVGRSVWSLLLLVPLRSRLVLVQGGGCGGRLRRRSPR
jgi:hypothetical protein